MIVVIESYLISSKYMLIYGFKVSDYAKGQLVEALQFLTVSFLMIIVIESY